MNQDPLDAQERAALDRRLFLQSLGKWSGAAITAAVAVGWLASGPNAMAGRWINRRGGGGGGWINRGGGGGGWVNRRGWGGGGGWINRW
jgi:rSAM-associated Gly-rich repeat protein